MQTHKSIREWSGKAIIISHFNRLLTQSIEYANRLLVVIPLEFWLVMLVINSFNFPNGTLNDIFLHPSLHSVRLLPYNISGIFNRKSERFWIFFFWMTCENNHRNQGAEWYLKLNFNPSSLKNWFSLFSFNIGIGHFGFIWKIDQSVWWTTVFSW